MSPLRLFQERYADDPWRLLCCVICLNLCSGRALESIHGPLFSRWPTALHMAIARVEELQSFLELLGLQRRRALSLIRMSTSWSCLWDGKDPDDMPGIGKYGSDSFLIFIRGKLDIPVADKELRKYLEWTRR